MCARKFYEYLVKNGLYREAITWLESCQNSSSCFHSGDSLNFELASNYLKTEKYDSAHAYFTRIKVLSDTSYVLTSIYLAILMSDTDVYKRQVDIGKHVYFAIIG